VLTDLALEVPGVKISEMYPKQPPDLFRGTQLVLMGAYEGSGPSAIKLKGRMGKDAKEYVYEATFPAKTTERTFIGPLYAHRKIGFLLDQIRLHGENKELKDEVVRLSLAYGIETPFTSYLVLENAEQYKQYGIQRHDVNQQEAIRKGNVAAAPSNEKAADALSSTYSFGKAGAGGLTLSGAGGATGTAPREPASRPSTTPSPSVAPPAQLDTIGVGGGGDQIGGFEGSRDENRGSGMRTDAKKLETAQSGTEAVDIATEIKRMKEASGGKDARGVAAVQEKGGHRFLSFRGVWVDERFQGTEKLTKIKWGSEAYFRLAREKTDLRDAFTLGQRVVVVTARGQAIAIDAEAGEEKLADDAFKALFTEAPAEKPAKAEEKPAKAEEKPAKP
jgi:Ca-activated chloride channel homolog